MTLAEWCVFGAVLLYLSTIVSIKWIRFRGFDNSRPRDPAFYADAIAQRALGAHQNGIETFPFFAFAVLLAEFRDSPQRLIDELAVLFLIVRIAYVLTYLGNRPTLRSILWSIGFAINLGIFFMSRRLISTGSPLEKTVGYSRAVIDGDFAFVAGTTGYDYTTMTMPADVTSQSRNCFKTIEAALKEGGFEMADIVRATYYVTDASYIDAHFAVCGEVLGDIRPAATLLVVSALAKPEMKVEIEVTAKRRSV